MSKSYAVILQKLCNDYMNHKLSFESYRRKRKTLLIKIDEQFNGRQEEDQDLTSPEIPVDAFGLSSLGMDAKEKQWRAK